MRSIYLRSLELHSLFLRLLVAKAKEGQGVWVQDVPVTRNGKTFMRGVDKYGYPAKRNPEENLGSDSIAMSPIIFNNPDLQKGWDEVKPTIPLKGFSNFAEGVNKLNEVKNNIRNFIDKLPVEAKMTGIVAIEVGIVLATTAKSLAPFYVGILAPEIIIPTTMIAGGILFLEMLNKNKNLRKDLQKEKFFGRQEKTTEKITKELGKEFDNPEDKLSLSLLGEQKQILEALKREKKRQENDVDTLNPQPTLEQRIKETLILMREKDLTEEQKISLEWHKGIIQMELKYGKILDKTIPPTFNPELNEKQILSTDFKKNNLVYNQLLSAISKTSSQQDNIQFEKIFDPNKPYNFFSSFSEEEYDFVAMNVKEELAKMSKIIDTKQTVVLAQDTSSRPFAEPEKNQINLNLKFFQNTEDSIIWHEVGHLLEVSENFVGVSKNYTQSRLLRDKEGTLLPFVSTSEIEKLYSQEEIETFRASNFDHYYTTKEYENATEVISRGMEAISDSSMLAEKVESDREHLMFTLHFIESTHHNN